MAKRKFIQQGDAKGGPVSIDVPQGKYAGFLIRIFGTTSAAQTLLNADVGMIRINRDGKEVIAETFDFFHCYDDLKGGFLPTATGGAAAAEDIYCFVPCSLPELPNVMNVPNNEQVDLKLDFTANLPLRFVALPCTYQVYGYLTEDIVEAYQLLIREQDVQAAAAGRLAEMINGKNLASLYLIDAGGILNSFSLSIDGQIVVDNIDDVVERAITAFENRVEVATTLVEVNQMRTGNFQNAINGNTELELIFSGAGTVNITAFQVSTPNI